MGQPHFPNHRGKNLLQSPPGTARGPPLEKPMTGALQIGNLYFLNAIYWGIEILQKLHTFLVSLL